MNSAVPSKAFRDDLTQKNRQNGLRILDPAKRYLDSVASLPPAPMLVAELRTVFRDPDRDVDKVVQLITYEPSLTAQILRTCNSASFAGDQPPADIFEAVWRVGFYQIYCQVVSIFGAKTKSIEEADKGVNVDELVASLWE